MMSYYDQRQLMEEMSYFSLKLQRESPQWEGRQGSKQPEQEAGRLFLSNKQEVEITNWSGAKLETLKEAHHQWHHPVSRQLLMAPQPLQIVSTNNDQEFKYVSLWGIFFHLYHHINIVGLNAIAPITLNSNELSTTSKDKYSILHRRPMYDYIQVTSCALYIQIHIFNPQRGVFVQLLPQGS